MRLAVMGVLFVMMSRSASAAIIVNNLAEAVAGTAAVSGPLGAAESWTAVRFTVGAGTWQFNNIVARLRDDSVPDLNPDGLIVDVRSDAGANPGGTILGSLAAASNITAEANYSFTPSAAFSLTGGVNYWLVARPTNDASLYGWFVTIASADNGASGWSLDDSFAGSADSGSNWTAPLPVVPLLSIDATLIPAAVPEPGSSAFMSISLVAIAARRRFGWVVQKAVNHRDQPGGL